MRVVGAVLAGGRSRRFGSDKALALLHGRPLIDHAADALRPHCDALVIVGRTHGHLTAITDRPRSDMGPLGGMAGALAYAAAQGFDAALTVPVDCVVLPADLRDSLSPASAFLTSQPVIGLWSAALAHRLDDWLACESDLAVRAFARQVGARAVQGAFVPPNVNRVEDLDRLAKGDGGSERD
ncbi:MAG: molybdenum cofactor guanylyltransferase [Sphingopyxis sp.]|uniref:molybdenum cofactor guanylyltransferase n=1 Tax=Sphingopyxis sp. TaxID=1908224 RepID=UPI002AB8E68A|nr:molybdenum cofactor guanylyltransferase [Sphingopyxis sp.]MDZ3833313.1 molybdenum cofactor guanylyltransferase [Sphingopyxis sp.]